jgi:hypothetical protein
MSEGAIERRSRKEKQGPLSRKAPEEVFHHLSYLAVEWWER